MVPRFDTLSPNHSRETVDDMNEIVNILLDENFKWDVQKVWSMFSPHIAINILKIKLGEVLRPDIRIWLGERFKNINVKNAYRPITSGSLHCLKDTSTSTTRTPLWKKNLKLKHSS